MQVLSQHFVFSVPQQRPVSRGFPNTTRNEASKRHGTGKRKNISEDSCGTYLAQSSKAKETVKRGTESERKGNRKQQRILHTQTQHAYARPKIANPTIAPPHSIVLGRAQGSCCWQKDGISLLLSSPSDRVASCLSLSVFLSLTKPTICLLAPCKLDVHVLLVVPALPDGPIPRSEWFPSSFHLSCWLERRRGGKMVAVALLRFPSHSAPLPLFPSSRRGSAPPGYANPKSRSAGRLGGNVGRYG